MMGGGPTQTDQLLGLLPPLSPPPHLLPPWWGRGARERGFSRILLELLFPTAVNKIL